MDNFMVSLNVELRHIQLQNRIAESILVHDVGNDISLEKFLDFQDWTRSKGYTFREIEAAKRDYKYE